jgi:hypothetical protein
MSYCLYCDQVAAPAPDVKWWRLAVLACALTALSLAGSWIGGQFRFRIDPEYAGMIDAMIIAMVVAYVFAMATPFIPGIEIGLALMLVLGSEGILLVYLATQLALAMSFLLGRAVPTHFVIALFRRLRLERARRLVEEINAAPLAKRTDVLAASVPTGGFGFLARHPFLALALILNVPGNALIGGAGGIGMIAGMSRAYPFPRYLLLVATATTPVPVFLLATGGH